MLRRFEPDRNSEMPSKLATELETYERELQSLLTNAPGKYVLIQGSTILSKWDTYEDAIQEGYRVCGLNQTFLVKKVEAFEFVHFNSRAVLPICHP
jgi:hypothetical protein